MTSMTRTSVSVCLFVVAVALSAAACSTVRTNYDYDPDADFGAWQTYAWYPAESVERDLRFDSPLIRGRVEAAVDRVLASRGYRRVEDASPDFYVHFHLATDRRLDVRTLNRTYRAGPAHRGWGTLGWQGVGWTETRVSEVEEGILVIDLIDTAAAQLAWRGMATQRLPRNPTPETVSRQMDAAVQEILARFPPR